MIKNIEAIPAVGVAAPCPRTRRFTGPAAECVGEAVAEGGVLFPSAVVGSAKFPA
jgi:hypothetical protein